MAKVNFLKHFKGDSLKSELLRGGGGVVVLKCLNIILALTSGVFLARVLGPKHLGEYTFALTVIIMMSLPIKAGVNTLLVREVSKNQMMHKWGLIRGLLRVANTFCFFYSVLVALSVAIYIYVQTESFFSVKYDIFLWGILLLPLFAFEGIRAGALRGLRWVVSSQLPEQLILPLSMIMLLFVFDFVLGFQITSTNAIQFHVISAFLAFLIGAYLLSRAIPNEVKTAKPYYTTSLWGKSLLPLTLFVGLKTLDSQISIVILGFIGTSEEVGLLRVATTGASLVTIGLIGINMAFAPQISRLYQAGEIEKLQRIIKLSTRAVAAISFPVAFVLIVWGEEIVLIVFGEEYIAASTALAILCLGQLVNASSGSVAMILNMTNNDKKTLPGALIALILNCILSVFLIPLFGVSGAAISFSISLIVWNVILVVAVKKTTGLNTFLWFK